jgi:hypothetical protein
MIPHFGWNRGIAHCTLDVCNHGTIELIPGTFPRLVKAHLVLLDEVN